MPTRNKLPVTRVSVTRKATICGFEVYIIVGFYDDLTGDTSDILAPGEVFIKASAHGSEMSGLLDTVAMLLSLSLQYGVPWEKLAEKMRYTKFGTADERFTSLCDGIASHITDLIKEREDRIGKDLAP